VRLVELGAVRPLVAMMAGNAEPRHYAGLALLKLADNFENHLRIAEEGGIQALLRLGRARSTDEQLQYKAALTVGQLASNAVRLLPKQGTILGGSTQGNGSNNSSTNGGGIGVVDESVNENTMIGYGASMMGKIRSTAAVQKGKRLTSEYLEKAVELGDTNAVPLQDATMVGRYSNTATMGSNMSATGRGQNNNQTVQLSEINGGGMKRASSSGGQAEEVDEKSLGKKSSKRQTKFKNV